MKTTPTTQTTRPRNITRWAALAVGVLAVAVAAGCGSNGTGTNTTDADARTRTLDCPKRFGPELAPELIGAVNNDIDQATTADGVTLLVNDHGPWVLIDQAGTAKDVYPSAQNWTDVRVAAGQSEFIVNGDLESSDDFADEKGQSWQVLGSDGSPLWRKSGGLGRFVAANVIQHITYEGGGEAVSLGFFDPATGNPANAVAVPPEAEFSGSPDISTSIFAASEGTTVWQNAKPLFDFPKGASRALINDTWALWEADGSNSETAIVVHRLDDGSRFEIEVANTGKSIEAICGDLAYATDGGTSIFVLDLANNGDQVGLIQTDCAEDVTVADARPGRVLISCYNEPSYRMYSGQ